MAITTVAAPPASTARRARRAHCETETTFCAQPHVLSRIEDGHETQTDLELPIATLLAWPSATRGGSVDLAVKEKQIRATQTHERDASQNLPFDASSLVLSTAVCVARCPDGLATGRSGNVASRLSAERGVVREMSLVHFGSTAMRKQRNGTSRRRIDDDGSTITCGRVSSVQVSTSNLQGDGKLDQINLGRLKGHLVKNSSDHHCLVKNDPFAEAKESQRGEASYNPGDCIMVCTNLSRGGVHAHMLGKHQDFFQHGKHYDWEPRSAREDFPPIAVLPSEPATCPSSPLSDLSLSEMDGMAGAAPVQLVQVENTSSKKRKQSQSPARDNDGNHQKSPGV
ncbi:hypothetical protein DFH08DRAFT_821942 [Mycena albidolilacea]|uniref:Uncharacterized protein n=1 Tax=Mycena albidolilacea TaxID=1033008 RepID=A0AAD6ZA12_9AGAR|nr:hypothetical protein DFH08DRAFT_821942 [Mycena albidolilacea]